MDYGYVICASHGSVFDLDGNVVHDPATAPQPAHDVRVRNGFVELRRIQSAD